MKKIMIPTYHYKILAINTIINTDMLHKCHNQMYNANNILIFTVLVTINEQISNNATKIDSGC